MQAERKEPDQLLQPRSPMLTPKGSHAAKVIIALLVESAKC
jgi:hypothetical protein